MKTIEIILSIIVLTASFLMYGCEGFYKLDNKVDFDTSDVERKMVINGFISPVDTLIRIEVSLSKPVVGIVDYYIDPVEFIEDAEVILSSDNSEIQLNYDPVENKYVGEASEFEILPGQTYEINVTSSLGRSASAVCTVPAKHAFINEVVVDTVRRVDNFDDYEELEYNVKWDDIIGESNFYRVEGAIRIETDNALHYNNIWEFSIYNDYKKEDKQITVRGFSSFYYLDFNNPDEKASATFKLLTTDRNYYEYHRTFYNHDPDNPFAEPSPLFSNVKNGYGIFAAYDQSVFEIEF